MLVAVTGRVVGKINIKETKMVHKIAHILIQREAFPVYIGPGVKFWGHKT